MPGAHREDDSRYCGASTIVSGQGTVYVNGKLWAVEGDEETHGNGDLISTVGSTVLINGKRVIVFGDTASGDDQDHPLPPTDPQDKSSNVFAY
jgi:uncharacterized Zn-binding protein involved in type VI secretion